MNHLQAYTGTSKQKEKQSKEQEWRNSTSWRKFDKLNKMESLVTPERKRQLPDPDQPVPKQKHGSGILPALERLLEEARAWSPSEKVNWSHLASKYGLTSPNSYRADDSERVHAGTGNIYQLHLSPRHPQGRRSKEAEYPFQCTVNYPYRDRNYKIGWQVRSKSVLERNPLICSTVWIL